MRIAGRGGRLQATRTVPATFGVRVPGAVDTWPVGQVQMTIVGLEPGKHVLLQVEGVSREGQAPEEK
jgi:hypothetical protein